MRTIENTPSPGSLETMYLAHLMNLPAQTRAEIRLFDTMQVAACNGPGLEGMGQTMRGVLAGDVTEAVRHEPILAGIVAGYREAGLC